MNTRSLNSSEYTFDPGAGTLTFTLAPDRVILVVNNTRENQILYNFACKEFTGILSGTTLTFTEVDVSGQNASDDLTVVIEERITIGQDPSADSFPVVLSTEQEAILDSIKTAVENIDLDLGTGGLSQEATQLLVKAVLDTIKLDTAGILVNTADIEALLTTIDVDTSNLDVLLSTRATETTLSGIKTQTDKLTFDIDRLKVDAVIGGSGSPTIMLPTGYLDAGGRQRVSALTAEGEYKNLLDKIPDLKDEEGTGTSVHVIEDNGVTGTKMSVAAGEWIVRESKYSHFYNSGESHFMEFTTQNFALEANVIKRIGYFSSNTTSPFDTELDGVWIESNGVDNEYYLNSFRRGIQVIKIPRASWDDPLDGTGASGLTIDFAAFNIFQMDFLWLGGSAIRFVAHVGGAFVNFHTYIHSGAIQGVICVSPHQPMRYEIRSTTGTGFLYDICCQVSTEGSQNTVGLPRAVSLGSDTINANMVGNTYLLVAVRLNSLKRNQVVNLSGFGGFATTNDAFRISILKNPTIANIPAWQDYSPSSSIQYITGDVVNNPSNTTITGGELLKSFGVSQRAGEATIDIRDVLFKLGRNLDGTSDVLAIVGSPLSPNLDLSGQLEMIEKI